MFGSGNKRGETCSYKAGLAKIDDFGSAQMIMYHPPYAGLQTPSSACETVRYFVHPVPVRCTMMLNGATSMTEYSPRGIGKSIMLGLGLG